MESNKDKTLFSVTVYLSLLVSACLRGVLAGGDKIDVLARAGYLVILGAVFLMIVYWNEEFIWRQIQDKWLYLGAFCLSVLLLGVASVYSVGCYWFLLLMVAVCTAQLPGMAVSYGFLMVVYVIQVLWDHPDPSRFAYYLIMGAALMLIFSMVQKRKEVPYAAVILLALSTALQILLCRFQIVQIWQERYLYLLEITSILFLMLFGTAQKLWQEIGGFSGLRGKNFSRELLPYLEDGFPLLESLKQHTELYQHSYEISRMSSLAANQLGADAALAAAGGMYHEVGRISKEDNYMKESMKLAEQHGFPEKLQAVIRQHNAGSEIPQSPEAAIVMLSDYIVSTSKYLRDKGKRSAISDERLVEGVFNNRIEKGNLEECGLTGEQIQSLKMFFIEAERQGYPNDNTDGKGNG